MRRPSGFVEPCLPSKVVRPPSGSLWLHEIKFDGYRLMVRCAAPPTPGHEAVLYAFDLIEHDGDDLRDLPLIERKRRLAKLIGKAKQRHPVREHLTGDGPTVFDHVCRMGLEGIVSKRTDAPYRSGPSKTWLKSKNPASEAVRREREEEWR